MALMAGSWIHVTTEDGQLLSPAHLRDMLENDGDVYESVEEMYGMIWWLASNLEDAAGQMYSAADLVENARLRHVEGINLSPGPEDER